LIVLYQPSVSQEEITVKSKILRFVPIICLVYFGTLAGADDLIKDPKPAATHEPLEGTKPLTMEGDIASQLVAGVDRFLLRKIEESVEKRARHWKRDFSSAEAYSKSIEPNRKRLAHILGMRDPRVPFDAPELVATTAQPALVGTEKVCCSCPRARKLPT
jgi:hypothetical protein